ncbi:AfsR/SARP family transcriptional regulator [Zafaria cholistanensis]|uniref:AfsR/SARP family transcriptional regulator n=1 Tax=Zafaria cholistanensis TaxID=1682741 RepID=UPI001CEDBF2E|nr:BTAD domain-containing putative transcriptional regulator [Zafaria cholistanensis]
MAAVVPGTAAVGTASGSAPQEGLRQPALSVEIIGGLVVRRGDTVLTAHDLGGPKSRQILEILLLQLGTPVSKNRLIELLWGNAAPKGAVPTLESYVSVLRRSLQPGLGKSGPLKTTTGGYWLDRAMVDLDLDRFEALLRKAEQAAPAEAYPLLRRALDMAGAPLLGDELLSDWAENERTFHASRVTAARLLAAESAARLGRLDEAAALAQVVLAGEPLNESAWSILILALEEAGRPVEGLQAYERCRRAMAAELGCAPGPGLQQAQERMLLATAGSEDEFGQVLGALLDLHRHVAGGRSRSAGTLRTGPGRSGGPAESAGLAEAGNIVQRYLRLALAAV